MSNHMLRTRLLALALCLASVGTAPAQSIISGGDSKLPILVVPKLYVFGDSLSDGGAGIALADGMCDDAFVGPLACGKRRTSVKLGAPYFEGRSFSDGPVSVDVMARLFGLALSPGYHNPLVAGVDHAGGNYAISGARAYGEGVGAMFSLDGQIDAFAHHYDRADPAALHVILIGGNDLIAAIPRNDAAAVTRAVGAVQAGVDRLAGLGARRIMVYKLLPMRDVPRFASEYELHANADALTAQFNAGIDALRTPAGVTLLRFDMAPTWNLVKQQLWWHGRDYKTACAPSSGDVLQQVKGSAATDVVISASWLSSCAPDRRDYRAFFDEVHPSAYLHQMIGQAAYDFAYESLNGGKCAPHAWGNEAPASLGAPADRRGLLGSIHRYDDPGTGQRKYFRLIDTGSDGAYWYYPADLRDNPQWQFVGLAPPKNCGTAFRSVMNLWDAKWRFGGLLTFDFTAAKAGDRFVYFNYDHGQVEYYTFLDPKRDGEYWYFPGDGISSNQWWARGTFD